MYLVNIYRDALNLVYFTKLIIIIINSGYLFLFLRTGRTSIKVRFYSFYKWSVLPIRFSTRSTNE